MVGKLPGVPQRLRRHPRYFRIEDRQPQTVQLKQTLKGPVDSVGL
jgi:hypothetical protein